MKVLFLTNVPSPYRVDFFNELGKLCDLTVLFEKKTSSERDKSWQDYKFDNFKGVFLKGISIRTDSALCFGIKKYLKDKSFDVIVCSNFSSPTGMRAVRYLRRKKIKYFIESDGGFAGTGKGLKEKIKRYFIKGASGYFSTAKEHDKYYLTYGAQEDKLFRYPFTSLFEKDIVDSVPSAEKKEELRAQLGVSNKRVVLTVGQFIHRKGFDLLLRSASRLKDFDFYFVGGVATQEYTELKSQLNLDNVYFVGFTNKEQLKKYYQCADLFALPTREDIWGLVVNEAMANGLPVVSTQRCVSATELVKDDVNGYVIPTNDVDALTNAISTILSDEQKIIEMSKNSLDIIHNYTFEQMAKVHIQIFSLIRETEYDKAKTND